MRIALFFSLILLLSSCSSLKSQTIKKKTPLKNIISASAKKKLELGNDTERSPDSHELVEASADDSEIEETFGSKEIDEEIPEELDFQDVEDIKPFLQKKNTRRMKFWVNYFIEKDRERFQRFINNGEEYRQDIEAIFASYGLPKDLYYVGLIESGYYLGAKSRAKAVGPWQFIKGTGKRYGLKVSRDIDERRDLFKSTHAAARYLRDLNNVFLSWELSLAAYNAGEYGVLRRIMKHKTRDYYLLSKNKKLPSETINYVPKVLAAMHVIKNAHKYNFHIPKNISKKFANTELHPIQKNVSLRSISKRLNISLKDLKRLNPELLKDRTPRIYRGTYSLRIPQGMGNLLAAPFKRQSRREVIRRTASASSHRVRRGETLTGIARRYKTTAGHIARVNKLPSWRSELRIGQVLKLNANSKKNNFKPIHYVVKRGDSLSHLAKLFRIKVSEIKRANRLKSGRIISGQKLVLPNTKRGIYTVREGDHLIKISKKFNQPLDAILKINSLKRRTIFPGQKLIVNID